MLTVSVVRLALVQRLFWVLPRSESEPMATGLIHIL
jgi:hypothetical protein